VGIYAVADSLVDVVPYYSELDAAGRAQGDSLLKFVQAVVANSRSRFARFPQNTVVDIRGANHYVFLQRPAEVARAMRPFLSRLPKSREAEQPRSRDASQGEVDADPGDPNLLPMKLAVGRRTIVILGK
jgi:hypothetical protein